MATIQRGQAITFRLPSDTPDHILKQLQKLKETEKRNFSSTIAEFALEGVKNSLVKNRESITIPLPKPLTKEQRSWLKHSHSEALIGTIIYQLLEDPIRATAIFASLNSHQANTEHMQDFPALVSNDNRIGVQQESDAEDDLDRFELSSIREQLTAAKEDEEEQEEDPTELLGDFIAQMNKQ